MSQVAGVSISQSVSAAFGDRVGPDGVGVGLLVEMVSGNDGQYLEHDLGAEQQVLHVRVMLNAAAASGGEVIFCRTLDASGDEVLRAGYAADSRTVTVTLATSDTLSFILPTDGPAWHCVEVQIDAAGGDAALFVNGIERDTASGSFSALTVRYVRLGGIYKNTAVTGTLYLDEWIMADAYIGPVIRPPVSSYADDPARWLVIYNTASDDSRTWADSYRRTRSVPYANLLGIDLSTNETITEAQYGSMRSAVDDYLSDNDLGDQILGILCGHDVPGYFTVGSSVESVADQLHRPDTSTTPLYNPLLAGILAGLTERPGLSNLSGFRMTARIDGPTLADSQALTSRAVALETNGLTGSADDPGAEAAIWLDLYGPENVFMDLREAQMADWVDSVDRKLLRLPLELSAASDPPTDVNFTAINHDGFFWGWEQLTVPSGFFSTPAGDRVFCLQLTFNTATCPTVRNASDDGWVISALQAGYAAAAGSSRSFLWTSVPLIHPFFEALRRGWALGEAWFVASPMLQDGLTLVGDPLMTVQFPVGGWNMYGPFDSWANMSFDEPLEVLRQVERELTLDDADRPSDGADALYVIRHLDAQGRAEADVRHVLRHRDGSALQSLPWAPAWPSAPGWSARRDGDDLSITAIWGDRFGELGITQVDLIEQEPGQAEQVVDTITVDSRHWRTTWQRTPPGATVRYRIRTRTADGGTADSPWSAWMIVSSDQAQTIELI